MGAREWAARLAELMPEDEFCRFVGFYDVCDDLELWDALTAIDAERHPDEYVGDFDADGNPRVLGLVSADDVDGVGSELELEQSNEGRHGA